MNKSVALLVGLFLITLFGVLSFVLPDAANSLGIVLGSIVTLVSAYIGLQVANNGVKGKFFNQALYDSENPQSKGD